MKLFDGVIVITLLLRHIVHAVPSYLQFNEDSISNEYLHIWKARLTNLQERASSDDDNLTGSYTGALMSDGNHGNNDNAMPSKHRQLFEEFRLLFGRSYNRNDLDYDKRFKVFVVC